MARLIAIEWDARQARVAVGRTRGSDVVIEDAFGIDLASADDSGQGRVGEQLAAALAARSVGRGDVLVAVGRSSTELRMLTLPPAPPEELPDMVRFQAMRQFSGIGEDWPLDFVSLDSGDSESLGVLAATMSPATIQRIQQSCDKAQLSVKRLVLRPFAAASLYRQRSGGRGTDGCLMVDFLADEADLAVLAAGQVVFIRTVRLPATGDAETHGQALLGEIRRTVGAAQNQLGGKRVERVTLCGSTSDHAELKQLIENQLSLPVDLFDPFEHVPLGRTLRNDVPEHPGRYAPLFGMLVDEAAGGKHDLDFLQPRRRPTPPNTRRRNALLAATAATLLLAGAFLVWIQLRSLDQQILELQVRSKGLDKQVAAASERRSELSDVEAFVAGDVTWLDELNDLSQELPSADDAIVTSLTLSARIPQGGLVVMQGYVREPSAILAMENSLRDERHRVVGDRGLEDDRRERYRWQFKELVYVEKPDQNAASAPPGESVPDEAVRDEAVPDEAVPDEAAPDEAAPDERQRPGVPERPAAGDRQAEAAPAVEVEKASEPSRSTRS